MDYDEYVGILDDVSDSVDEECTAVHKKCLDSNSTAPLSKWIDNRVQEYELFGYVTGSRDERSADYYIRFVLRARKGDKKNYRVLLSRDAHGDVVRMTFSTSAPTDFIDLDLVGLDVAMDSSGVRFVLDETPNILLDKPSKFDKSSTK